MNVTICSRKAAEELLRTDALSHTAVISFCDPPSTDRPAPTPPLDYTGAAARVFTVAVRDLDLSVLPDVGLTYDTYLLEADALAAFIYQARADGLWISSASANMGRAAAPPALPQFWSISTAPASLSLPTTAITPIRWCITRS